MSVLLKDLPASLPRRRALAFAGGAAAVLGLATQPAAAAAFLDPTPSQLPGPFYPPLPPYSVDSDLLSRGGRAVTVKGQVLRLSGQLRDQWGRPIAGARVEIWQADADGNYRDAATATEAGDGFQGAGHAVTDAGGHYRFRTLKPGPYGVGRWARTPHIHFLVVPPGGVPWTSQMYFKGEPGNSTDFLLADVGAGRDLLVREMTASAAEPGAMAIDFPIILGMPGVLPKEG